jgi:hypothetical protein
LFPAIRLANYKNYLLFFIIDMHPAVASINSIDATLDGIGFLSNAVRHELISSEVNLYDPLELPASAALIAQDDLSELLAVSQSIALSSGPSALAEVAKNEMEVARAILYFILTFSLWKMMFRVRALLGWYIESERWGLAMPNV